MFDLAVAERTAYVTVPREMAVVNCDCAFNRPCKGLSVNSLPLTARALETHLREIGYRFINRMEVRGLQYLNDMRLHGPWVSREFDKRMADVQSELFARAVKEDDPSLIVPFVVDEAATSPYSDYLLVGKFIMRPVPTLMATVKEATNGKG